MRKQDGIELMLVSSSPNEENWELTDGTSRFLFVEAWGKDWNEPGTSSPITQNWELTDVFPLVEGWGTDGIDCSDKKKKHFQSQQILCFFWNNTV